MTSTTIDMIIGDNTITQIGDMAPKPVSRPRRNRSYDHIAAEHVAQVVPAFGHYLRQQQFIPYDAGQDRRVKDTRPVIIGVGEREQLNKFGLYLLNNREKHILFEEAIGCTFQSVTLAVPVQLESRSFGSLWNLSVDGQYLGGLLSLVLLSPEQAKKVLKQDASGSDYNQL